MASIARAREFGLVLVSQGIEAEIHRDPSGAGAELRVDESDFPRAQLSIQRYQEENRHRRWQSRIPRSGLVYDWQCMGWVVLNGILYALQTMPGSPMQTRGDFNSGLVRSGEWWRAITATGLHADLHHVGSNLMTGMVFLGLAMASYGAGVALFVATACGAVANGMALWIRPGLYSGLGASGVVMAALGLLSIRAFHWREWRERASFTALRGFICALFLLVLFGFNPESDVVVHLLGFGLGAVAGLLLTPFADNAQRQGKWDLPMKLCFAATVSVAWWLALRS